MPRGPDKASECGDDRWRNTRLRRAVFLSPLRLNWHRREQKALWWEYFRLSDLNAEDLLDERAGLADLTFVHVNGGTAKAPIHRYSFPPQETEMRGGEDLRNLGGAENQSGHCRRPMRSSR